MLFNQYPMFVPKPNAIKEYVRFYKMYGSSVRYAIVIREILQNNKEDLGSIFQDMIEEMQIRDAQIPSYLACMGLSYNRGERGCYDRSLYATDNAEIEKFYNGDLSEYIEQQINFRLFLNLYTAFESTITDFVFGEAEQHIGKQVEILSNLANRVAGLCKRFQTLSSITTNAATLKTLWKYYSLVRNLYVHNGGFVNQKFLGNLGKIQNELSLIISKNETIFLEQSPRYWI